MKFKKRVVRRVADTQAEPKTYAERELQALDKEQPRLEDDPYLNKGCRGCLWAMAVFFLAFLASLVFGKCLR